MGGSWKSAQEPRHDLASLYVLGASTGVHRVSRAPDAIGRLEGLDSSTLPDFESPRRRLHEQIPRGQTVLFTGAGFSQGASDLNGTPIPQVKGLTEEIWRRAWPDEDVPDDASLRSTYAAALREARGDVASLMRERLTVDPESVSESHRLWLSMPWLRAYTINIDNLEAAAQIKHRLPRRIHPFSALAGRLPLSISDLLYVHLNGALEDVPDVTFTDPQYGLRHSQTNPLYEQLAADLLSYTVVFVGTELQESLFWEYVALRDERGPRGVREGRPVSYLVTPHLARDRERLLDAYNVEWIEATHEEFASNVLATLDEEAERGFASLAASNAMRISGQVVLPTVQDLMATPPSGPSDYLLGAQPTWEDILGGRAVARDFEEDIELDQPGGCLLVTGTAGAGTSTTLMRIAVRLVEGGRDVRWLGADHAFDARDLGRELRKPETKLVLFIDDADTFGPPLMELITDVLLHQDDVLVVLGMRASRVDRILSQWSPDEDRAREVNVPLLEDNDIEALLATLEHDNKLGALKPLDPEGRARRVRQECGRELLVAMIEATSGERFEVKAVQEYDELEPEQRLIYGLVAIASALRFALTKDEILMASGDLSNTALFALGRLAARRLLVINRSGYALRHRRLAELVVASMRSNRQLLAPYRGLLRTMASRYRPKDRRARETKLTKALMNHSRIGRDFSLEDARQLYADVEELAKDDYHYWLQRGSLEVEHATSLTHAGLWLQQARDGGASDYRVQTEWAYYLLKRARLQPARAESAELVEEGRSVLLEQIELHGKADTYPWHVYGSQMLGWLRAAHLPPDELARELETVKKHMDEAVRLHPSAGELRNLRRDIEEEWLMTAVAKPGS
jgi:hypothetical protein